ncbi:MAG: hypothetical protein ACI4VI_01135 [Acutalibacteraceae bacterium]
MKKKISDYSRKALSVFMAVLMVFSMFALAPEMFTKAEAANGSYYVKITWVVTNRKGDALFEGDNFDNNYTGISSVTTSSNSNNCAGMSLFFKENNGRSSTEKEAYWDLGKNNGTSGGTNMATGGHLSDSDNSTHYATATITGFPTRLFAMADGESTAGSVAYKVTKIEVGASSSSTLTTIWSGTGYVSTTMNCYYFNLYPTTEDGNNSSYGYANTDTPRKWTFPYVPSANTVYVTSAVANIGIPPLGDSKDVSISTRNIQYYAYDNYGVRYEPTSYSVSGVSNLTTGSGWSLGNAYTITATTSTTKSTTATYQTATATLNWNNGKSTTGQHANSTYTFKVYNPRYKVTYSGNGGTLATTYIWAYYYRPINDATSTATPDGAEKLPTTGTRTGYTFDGIYTASSGGTKIAETRAVTATSTYYAHWLINQYTATFLGGKERNEVIGTSTVDYLQTPVEPSAEEIAKKNYSDGDYDYTFAGWDKAITAIGAADVTYTATYTSQFVPANYDAVDSIIAEAQAIQNSPNYEAVYSEESRNNLQAALDTVVRGKGRTAQDVVDGYVTLIREAIDGLGRQKYSVLFINSVDNSVIEMRYPVYFGDAITMPADPETQFNKNEHYIFADWEPSESGDDITSVSKNMVILAKFNKEAHSFTVEDLPSNCTSQAGKKYTCSCGYSYVEYSGSVGSEHDLSTEWTVDIEATCVNPGSKSHHCTRCGYRSDVTEIPALGHDYTGVDYEEVISAGCDNEGAEMRECNRCGYNDIRTTTATGHDWVDEVVPATCTENGFTRKTCNNCGDVMIVDFQPLKAHDFVINSDEHINPTCTGLGQRVYYCSLCNTQKVETVSATGHTWADEATVDFEPTCEKAGQKSIKCTVCGTVKGSSVEIIDALGHDYPDDWTVLVDATCKGEGVKTKECSRCDAAVFDKIPATGHDFNIEEVLVPATCGVNSVKKYHCANGCGEYIVKIGKENYEHDYGDWSVTPATCTAAGLKSRTCERCKNEETEVISMVPHSYTETMPIDATCTMPAGTKYKCATCDSTYTVYSGDANGHDLEYTVDGGKVTIKCRNCTFEKTFDADVPVGGGHNWNKVSATDATCTDEGSIVFACTDVGCTVENVTVTVPVNSDAHDISTTVTQPTCTEKGKVVTECSRCDYEVVKEIDAKGHTYSFPGTVTKTATCQENGVITYTCIDCGATMTETIDKIGHVFEATAETYAATCVAPAYTVYKCKTCDEKVNVTTGNSDPSKHNWEVNSVTNGAVTTVTVTCTECGATKTTDVPAGHNFNKSEIISPATCNSTGLVRLYCGDADCDYEIDVELMTVGHNYDAVYTAPSCSTEGSIRYICSDCGAEDSASAQVLPAIGHTWGTDVVDHKDPTCVEDGYDEYKCIRCNDTHREVIAKLGHDWVENTALYVAPTCKTDGKRVFECSRDGCDAKVEIVISFDANTVHNYEITTVAPTCAAPGFDKYVCLDCGDTMYKNMTPATGVHTFKSTDIPATCITKGGTHFECEVCHLQYDVLDGDYAEHTWAKEWTVDTEPTCTQNGSKSIRCTVCGAKGSTAVILKLPHSIDMSKSVNGGTGDNYSWLTFKCRTCDYRVAQFTIFAKDENGNVIPDAQIKITDSNGNIEKSGKADENGCFCTENTLFKNGNYTVTITADDNHKTDGVLTVAQDGSVSGSIGHISKSVCGHLCHKDNFIGRLIRSICTFFSAKFNRTIKCCDDMEWYGKYAEGLK